MSWSGGYVEWTEGDTAYLSIVFSWLLGRAYSRAIYYKSLGYKVRAGGPAVDLNPGRMESVAELGGAVCALYRHNPDAVFTSRGCNNKCQFCAVPRTEGDLVELADWSPAPVICDNNILQTSSAHFNRVIDRLKKHEIKAVDFNQGLEARIFCYNRARRIAELDLAALRFAWDTPADEYPVLEAIELAARVGISRRKIRVYVLVGYKDTPAEALYKCERLKAAGAWPYPMRYQPLDAERKNSYVGPAWTEIQLRDFIHYWSRLFWYEHIDYKDYDRSAHYKKVVADPSQPGLALI